MPRVTGTGAKPTKSMRRWSSQTRMLLMKSPSVSPRRLFMRAQNRVGASMSLSLLPVSAGAHESLSRPLASRAWTIRLAYRLARGLVKILYGTAQFGSVPRSWILPAQYVGKAHPVSSEIARRVKRSKKSNFGPVKLAEIADASERKTFEPRNQAKPERLLSSVTRTDARTRS
jgi:hypothetical protein